MTTTVQSRLAWTNLGYKKRISQALSPISLRAGGGVGGAEAVDLIGPEIAKIYNLQVNLKKFVVESTSLGPLWSTVNSQNQGHIYYLWINCPPPTHTHKFEPVIYAKILVIFRFFKEISRILKTLKVTCLRFYI